MVAVSDAAEEYERRRADFTWRWVTITRCPACGISDDLPMDSAPLPETDEQARAYCTTCGRRVD